MNIIQRWTARLAKRKREQDIARSKATSQVLKAFADAEKEELEDERKIEKERKILENRLGHDCSEDSCLERH